MTRAVAFILLVLILPGVAAVPASAKEELPDLVQYRPYFFKVQTVRENGADRFHFGFASNVQNWGEGPLEVHGSRPSQDQPEMTVEQVITSDDGSRAARPVTGTMRFVETPTHNHWHYQHFDTYSLRRARDFKLVAPDQKTGFCLGDRFKLDYTAIIPRTGPEVFTGGCGFDEPELLEMTEGISVGYGDDYGANLEGQYIDITKVPAGDYYLVHHVNADRSLRETDYRNNVSSAGVRISWPNGHKRPPRLVKQKICAHSDHCPFARGHQKGRSWVPVPSQPKVMAAPPKPSAAARLGYCTLHTANAKR